MVKIQKSEDYMLNKRKSAFTLAEILVTLMIIGVISVLTIPGLQQNAQIQANVAAAKKAYSTVSNATKELKTAKGPIRFWDMSSAKTIADMYKERVNINPYDIESYPIKNVDGSSGDSSSLFGQNNSFMSADGMYFFITGISSTCTGDGANTCFRVNVDTNASKGPNKIGYDLVSFVVTPEGVIPAGTPQPSSGSDAGNGSDSGTTDTAPSGGWDKTVQIITEGKISW